MSISTRTNLATNPSSEVTATFTAPFNCTIARVNTSPYLGAWHTRLTCTTAGSVTATSPTGVSGIPVTPGAVYTVSHYVKRNGATVRTSSARVVFYTAAGAFISTLGTTPGPSVGTTYQRISNTVTAPGAAAFAAVYVEFLAAAVGETFDVDATLFEASTTLGDYFDGSLVSAASIMYAWVGAANASTSTAKTYTPALVLVAKTDAPCPRVEITLTDLTPTTNTVTIWRTADGKRQAVRGFRKRNVVTSDFTTDYEVPLGRSVSYEVEVTAGVNAQAPAPKQNVTVNSQSGWIQDPLVPGTAVPVYGTRGPNGEANLRGQAMKAFEYKADLSIIPILGSPDPVALLGQRMSASGVDLSMATRAAQEAADLRNLLQQAPLVLVRPLPGWAAALPGLCYLASGVPVEQPVDEAWGGSLIWWELVGSLVSAPTMNVLVPLWTYGDVKALWGTYQQAQTALSGKSYLDVLKSPSGV